MSYDRWTRSILSFALGCGLWALPGHLSAQGNGTTTQGTDFWMGFMQNGYGSLNLKLVISAPQATSGTVEAPLVGYSVPFTVTANSTTTIVVPNTFEHFGSEVVTNLGIHITSMDTISVYAINTQSFTADGTGVLPLPSMGKDYIVSAGEGLPGFGNFYRSELLIVSAFNGTQVEITPSVNTNAGNLAGVPFNITLNAGQTYQIHSAQASGDLTGTRVRGIGAGAECRPFAVFSGSMCANLPAGCTACDHLFDQNYPITSWGKKFYTVPFVGPTHYAYRVIASQNGTTVTANGAFLIGLSAGQSYMVSGQVGPVCIEANKPIAAIQLMQGYSCSGSSGDPSMVMLNSTTDLLKKATFATAGSAQVTAHRLMVVTQAAYIGQVFLNGTPINGLSFTPFPACPTHVYANVNLTAGQHTFSAPNGAMAYPYGIGTGESYFFSLGVNAPNLLPMGDTVICASSGQVDLIAPPELIGTYWTTLANPTDTLATGQVYSFNPSASNTYVAHGDLFMSGCADEQAYLVSFESPSALTMTAVPAQLCNSGPVQLQVSANPIPQGMQITWSPAGLLDDPNIANPIATVTETTWFVATITSGTGCAESIDSVLVTMGDPKVVELQASATDDSLCQGASTTLGVMAEQEIVADGFNNGIGSMWGQVQGGTDATLCGSVYGKALYFNGNANRAARTNAMNTIGGGNVRFWLKIGSGAAPCDDTEPGEDVILQYSNNGGINWTTFATYNENAYPVFTAISENIPAAAQTANTMFRIRQPMHSGAGQDNWAIDDVVITKFTNTGLTLAWSPSGSLNNAGIANPVATPPTSTWYHITATTISGTCVHEDSIYISVGPTFTLTLPNDTSLCTTGSVPLHASPSAGNGHTWNWTPNNGTLTATNIEAPTATPTSTTTYQVTVISDHGCTVNGQVQVLVSDVDSVYITAADSSLCLNGSTQLTANVIGTSNGLSYSWSPAGSLNNTSIASPIATPLANTTYDLIVTDVGTGCTYSNSIDITVLDLQLDAGPDTITLCSAAGHVLDLQHNAPSPTFIWSPAAYLSASNVEDPTVLLDSSMTYTVTVTDGSGCSATDQIHINVPFSALAHDPDARFCTGDSALLDAGYPNATYLWSTAEISPSIYVTNPGNYDVLVTDNSGCQVTLPFTVTEDPLPIVALGPDTVVCAGATIMLDAGNPGSTYLWSNNAITQTTSISSNGLHWARVTDVNGCVASDSISIAFGNAPTVVLSNMQACDGDTITLDAGNSGASYLWSTNDTTQTIQVSTSGAYSVQVFGNFGCPGMDTAQVTFDPMPVVYLGPDTAICASAPYSLDAGNPGSTFLWSTNQTSQTINVNTTGIYWVDVSNSTCVSRDSISIAFLAMPTDVLNDVTLCDGQVYSLDAGNIGSSYQWDTNENTQSIEVASAGTYEVVVTTVEGCTDVFDATVTYTSPPAVDLGPDSVLCQGDVMMLDAGNASLDIDWSTGAIGQTIDVMQSGTYSVIVSDGMCVGLDTVSIIFNPRPSDMAVEELLTCLDEAPGYVVIDAGNPGSDFNWSSGESSQVILAGAYGWYFVEITNQYDCMIADSVNVKEFCPASIWVPNSFTPNGDGINDVFGAVGKNIGEMQLLIFDRWGNVIFESNDPAVGWDGTQGGQQVEDGVYVWRMLYKFEDPTDDSPFSQRKEQMGHVTLLR